MKHKNNLVIDRQTLELCRFLPEDPLSVHVGENTVLVIPESMTAMEAVNTINMLNQIITALLDALRDVCGTCRDQMKEGDGCPAGCQAAHMYLHGGCPYQDVRGPQVTLSNSVRREMGIAPDAKLDFFVDEGEAVVTAADYDHDITDVPWSVRSLLSFAGVCPARLDQVLKDGTGVWYG